MISHEAFVRRWVFSPLVRWPASVLEGASVPERSKHFLKEAGLPAATEIGGWEFGGDDFLQLPHTAELLGGSNAVIPAEVVDSHGIGRDRQPAGMRSPWIVVSDVGSGQVWQVHAEENRASCCFVNSSVPQLAESVLLCHLLLESRQGEPDDVFAELLRRSLGSIDPKALSEPDAFWRDAAIDAELGM